MGDFSEAETRALMAQHTEETGQRFTAAALEAVWTQTRGQPWLVNALCAGACFDNKAGPLAGEADVGVHGEVRGGGRASGGDRPPGR